MLSILPKPRTLGSVGWSRVAPLILGIATLVASRALNAQTAAVVAESTNGAYQLFTSPAGDVFLNTSFLGNSTTTRWSWSWSRTIQYPNPYPAYVHTKAWYQALGSFNSSNLTAAPIYGSYTSSLIGSFPHVFVFPVQTVQYGYNYYEYIYGPGSYSYYYNTWYDIGGRLTPRFTDAADTQVYGQIYAVLDADAGKFVDFFTGVFDSSTQAYGRDLNYFYGIKSQSYRFTPELSQNGVSPGLTAANFHIANNVSPTDDTVAVTGIGSGDIIRVYHDALGIALWGTGTVATGDTSVVIDIPQLGTTAGTVWISIQRTGMAESTRTPAMYLAEASNTPPVANAGPDATYEATSAAGAVVLLDGSGSYDTDHDTLTWMWTGTFGTATGVHPSVQLPLGRNVVTLTVSDGKTSSTDTVVITVVDTTAPTLSLPANISLEATSPAGAIANYAASATDLVSGAVPVTFSVVSGSMFPLGTTTVTAIATDAAGNRASGSFTVTVRDTTPPALLLPADLMLEATGPDGAVANFSASANDVVSGSVPVTYSISPGSMFPLGTTTVAVSATDAAGNTATGSFTVTVRDTTPPTLTLPANLIVEATGPSGAVATFNATAQDLVDGSVQVTLIPPSGSLFPLGTTTVTATATDHAGNTANGSFTVTVVDTTPPTILVPANIVVDSTSSAGAIVTYTATATDLVSGVVPVVASLPSGSTFPIGVTTVTLRATDGAGNTATASFTVTVLSPAQQIDALKDLVASLPELSPSEIATLTAKLDNVSASLDRGNDSSASGQLGAFINQVNALQNSGRISSSDATLLTAKAQNVQNQLG